MITWIRGLHLSATTIGVLVAVMTLASFVIVYQKDRISTDLRGGDGISAAFSTKPDLVPDESKVKIASVVVGIVTGVDSKSNGTSLVTMKLDPGVVDRLGSDPSARVRATLLLGGRHYVDLEPSGQGTFDGTIPAARTAGPVELGDVLRIFQPDARKGMRSSIRRLDQVLKHGGARALQRSLRAAPGTGGPAIPVFHAVQGTRPGQDLSTLIPNLNSLATAMASNRTRLRRLVSGLDGTTNALGRSRDSFAQTVGEMPASLPHARRALDSVTSVFKRLTTTASSARPVVRRLGPLLDSLDGALKTGKPVVHELRPLLHQTLPVVRDLVPTAKSGRDVLHNLSGSVIRRIRGPVVESVNSDFHGTGRYAGNGNNKPMYQVLGYLAARGANMSKYVDKNGSFLALALGAGVSSVGGTDISITQLLKELGVPQLKIDPLGETKPGSSSFPAPGSGPTSGTSPRAPARTPTNPLSHALGNLLGGN